MTASLLLSTDEVPPRERAPVWREWVWRHFGGLESELYGDSDFDGHIAASHAGEVILTRLEANRHRVLRTPQMARRSEADYLKIVAPWQGSAAVTQRGREASVRAGGWTLYDTTADYMVANPERSDHLIVMLPKAQLAVPGLPLGELVARRVGGASGISRVALETMRNTYLELPYMSEAAARGAGELIIQLVRLSLMELAGQETPRTQREALQDRIRRHVAQHLHDPALSIDGIAQALRCSKRHLHNAFAGEEDTLNGYILHQRLTRCIRALEDPANAARPITDIALASGFCNLSHFSRVFREHTGGSPSEFRRQAARR
ncbi:DNA-binding protein [Variovorax sp. WS11]|uniref:AraC-like ligand-binding domain-containing protein n=1 Tax=Variovorax sp. WS11 TaxID=1105204 RepID=UPI000D0D94A4|nr:helix-turn-helix domain-containing protein [Variovorax sp. WS11]NDZ14151.1 helix-turn-helix domain-containing protein [Variovorax sp. WS11]PSL79861.1 DNA-binding protein [Variovorax sp. WS11]